MPLKNQTTVQEVAPSVSDLQDSYNRLYQEWLGKHRDYRQANHLLSLLDVHTGTLLDFACGLGYLLDVAQDRGAKAYGLDISSTALRMGKAENPARHLVEGNGENLPWPDNTFDFIVCAGSLEHFINPDQGMREIARVLKPTGKAVISLPNSHHLQAIYNVYKMGSVLPELQDYERFATRVEWKAHLEQNGLSVQSVHKYNTGFSRLFKKGREPFWYTYNILYRLLGDIWIPTNLSFMLVFVCTKAGESEK